MAEYKYSAKDSLGKPRKGNLQAPSMKAARDKLEKMRFRSITVQSAGAQNGEISNSRFILGGLIEIDENGSIQLRIGGQKKPSSKDIIIMAKQLVTMLSSGVSIVQSLSILEKQQRVKDFGKVLEKIKGSVENGMKISDSFGQHPEIFDNLFVSMIRAGEESGKLNDILAKLIIYIEKSEKIKSQVKGAMAYPTFVLIIAVAIVSALLIFLVPTFVEQFKEGGQKLPALTQITVDLSDFLRAYFLHLAATAVVIAIVLRFHFKTPQGKRQKDILLLRLPILGDMLKKVAVGRLCSTLSTMLSSGVNILQSLNICATSAGNVVIEKIIIEARDRVEQGEFLSQPLADNPIFPSMVVSMIQVGEKSGRIDEMLGKVSEFYDEEVEVAVKTIISMIEPAMIVIVGGIVAFIVVAMYLPIFERAGNAGS